MAGWMLHAASEVEGAVQSTLGSVGWMPHAAAEVEGAMGALQATVGSEGLRIPRPIPGSYGIPFLSAIRDRLDFYYFQGQDRYFESRIARYRSTVLRMNVPPGPLMALDSRVVALLDAKSFPVLFDVSKVEKKNVFTGTYMSSTTLTGGYRVLSYLDPSEPNHAKIKQLLFHVLLSRKDHFIPAFQSNFSSLFAAAESQLILAGKSDFNKLNDNTSFDFLGEAYFGVRPSASSLGAKGPGRAAKWLFLQLAPLITLGLPMILEEPLLHTVPLPPILVCCDYKALYKYFSAAAATALNTAESLGLSRKEACHNLLFATVFNSYGGMKVLLPGILARVATAGPKLHAKLAAEIRAAVGAAGGRVTLEVLDKLELTKSVVWEALRLDPPVKFQYGRAKMDMEIQSHDNVFKVRRGEMLFGYQPCATKDPRVFASATSFVGDRFVGEGKKLLQYVYWSNGRETENPSLANKQCPGKDLVALVGRLLLVEMFLRYDTFSAEVGTELLGAKVIITHLAKATSAPVVKPPPAPAPAPVYPTPAPAPTPQPDPFTGGIRTHTTSSNSTTTAPAAHIDPFTGGIPTHQNTSNHTIPAPAPAAHTSGIPTHQTTSNHAVPAPAPAAHTDPFTGGIPTHQSTSNPTIPAPAPAAHVDPFTGGVATHKSTSNSTAPAPAPAAQTNPFTGGIPAAHKPQSPNGSAANSSTLPPSASYAP